MAVGLLRPSSGHILIDGHNLYDRSRSEAEHRRIRQRLQMVFQSPYASLNPRWRVGSILAEPLRVFGLTQGPKAETHRVHELLEQVGLSVSDASRFPHEFSGGQRQRIGIARALAAKPDFIVADEPISALDVSIQAQIINLMRKLQQQLKLTYLFIAHDLAVVRHISDRMAVMYLGKIVELAESEALYRTPRHPYTQALLSAIPIADLDRKSDRIVLEGDVPNPVSPPSGCAFHPRCPKFKFLSAPEKQRCVGESPQLSDATQLTQPHLVSCHYPN